MKNCKYTSFGVGAGVGAFAGMVGGPFGMILGCVIGGPLFGYFGRIGGKIISQKIKTNSQKSLFLALDGHWGKWKKNQTCHQCDGFVYSHNKHNCKNCGNIFCFNCCSFLADVVIKGYKFENVPICTYCEKILNPNHVITKEKYVVQDKIITYKGNLFIKKLFGWKSKDVTLNLEESYMKLYTQNRVYLYIPLSDLQSVEESINYPDIKKFGFVLKYKNIPLTLFAESLRMKHYWMNWINHAIHIYLQNMFLEKGYSNVLFTAEYTSESKFIFHSDYVSFIKKDKEINLGTYDELSFNGNGQRIMLTLEPTIKGIVDSRKDISLYFNYFVCHPYTTIKGQVNTKELNEDNQNLLNVNQFYKINNTDDFFNGIKDIEAIKNLSRVQLIRMFDDLILYKNKDLMHKVVNFLLQKETDHENIYMLIFKILRDHIIMIISKNYIIARQLFTDKQIINSIKKGDEDLYNNIENSKSLTNTFYLFKNWFQQIITDSPTFYKQVKESFSLLNRISILGQRKNLGYESGYLYFEDKRFNFRNANMELVSRKYQWEYDNVSYITNINLTQLVLRFCNGTTFTLISSYNDFIIQTIRLYQSKIKKEPQESQYIQPPRSSQYINGFYDADYLLTTDIHIPDQNNLPPEDINTILQEVLSLSSKLNDLEKIINEELESQSEMLEVIQEIMDKNKSERNTVQYKIDQI